MGEYLIPCIEWMENLNIQKAVAMNDNHQKILDSQREL